LSKILHQRIGRKRQLRQNDFPAGFTLVELLVTVATFALLIAVVLPRYLKARDGALIGTLVEQAVNYSKTCAVINAPGIDDQPFTGHGTAIRGGVTITQGCESQKATTGATLEVAWGLARADGIRCLEQRSTLTSQKAVITLAPSGELTCIFVS
jgi:prepilin-type N-terminal cleavage/methylation domain-containing protein